MNRRQLIQSVGAAVAAQGMMNVENLHGDSVETPNQEVLKDGATVLFQGDSITDAHRDKKKFAERPNNARALGAGYPFMIAGE